MYGTPPLAAIETFGGKPPNGQARVLSAKTLYFLTACSVRFYETNDQKEEALLSAVLIKNVETAPRFPQCTGRRPWRLSKHLAASRQMGKRVYCLRKLKEHGRLAGFVSAKRTA